MRNGESPLGFAIPLYEEYIQAMLGSISSSGKIQRPSLGIQYRDVTPELQEEEKLISESGIFVTNIQKDSSAEKAGLQRGDVIVSINGRLLNQDFPLLYQMGLYQSGVTKTLELRI